MGSCTWARSSGSRYPGIGRLRATEDGGGASIGGGANIGGAGSTGGEENTEEEGNTADGESTGMYIS